MKYFVRVFNKNMKLKDSFEKNFETICIECSSDREALIKAFLLQEGVEEFETADWQDYIFFEKENLRKENVDYSFEENPIVIYVKDSYNRKLYNIKD